MSNVVIKPYIYVSNQKRFKAVNSQILEVIKVALYKFTA